MMNNKWKIFLINLDRSTDRLDACGHELQRLKLDYERIQAVDGLALSDEEVSQVYSVKKSDYQKTLSKTELACYLSHQKVFHEIKKQKLNFAVVLEDDFLINESFLSAIESLQKFKEPWDIVKLSEFPIKRKAAHEIYIDDLAFVTYNKVPNRTLAQAVSSAGADKLLLGSEMIRRPIDIDIQYWWEKGLNVFGMRPYPVSCKTEATSTIDFKSDRKKTKIKFTKLLAIRFYFLVKNRLELRKRLKNLDSSVKSN